MLTLSEIISHLGSVDPDHSGVPPFRPSQLGYNTPMAAQVSEDDDAELAALHAKFQQRFSVKDGEG